MTIAFHHSRHILGFAFTGDSPFEAPVQIENRRDVKLLHFRGLLSTKPKKILQPSLGRLLDNDLPL